MALGDPTRREIFRRLVDRPRPVGELAQELPVSRPAVSQHLKGAQRMLGSWSTAPSATGAATASTHTDSLRFAPVSARKTTPPRPVGWRACSGRESGAKSVVVMPALVCVCGSSHKRSRRAGSSWHEPRVRDVPRSLAAHVRPRPESPETTRGLGRPRDHLRSRACTPPRRAPADVDGRARRCARDRSAERHRGRRRTRVLEARAPAATSHRPAGEAGRGHPQGEGARPARRRDSRDAATGAERPRRRRPGALRRILERVSR